MIEVLNLTKKFGSKVAVNNVSFTVKKGEVLGFLGPNGAGKSTTIRMIAGFYPPSEGKIIIDGKESSIGDFKRKAMIGYMPESNPLYGEMTVREFLIFAAEIHKLESINEKVSKVIEKANLTEVENQLIETLSKGYRSRLSFAAAIIHNPPILLLDEPTDGLDPNQKNEIRTLIKSLSEDKAIVVSTHILEEVEAMCTRLIIVSEGKLVLDGSPQELKQKSIDNNKVVVSIPTSEKEQAESALASTLKPIGLSGSEFRRYLIEKQSDLQTISSELSNKNIKVEEIFYFDAPLDEAFRKLTKTDE